MGAADQRATPLRPLGIGETVDAGLLQWRASVGPITMRCLVPVVATQLAATLITLDAAFAEAAPFSDGDTSLFLRAPAYLLLGFLGITACATAIARPVAADLLGVAPTRLPRARPGAAMIAVLLATALSAAATALAYVPGLVAATLTCLVGVVAVVERAGPGVALRRAARLATARPGSVFSALLLGLVFHLLLQYALAGAVELLFEQLTSGTSIVAEAVIRSVTGALAAGLSMPWTGCILVAAYCEARVRVEGLDVTVMWQEAASRTRPVVAHQPGERSP